MVDKIIIQKPPEIPKVPQIIIDINKANEEIKGIPSFKEEKPKYSASTPYKPKSKNKSSPGHFVYGKEASNKKKSTYSYGKGRRTKK